MINIKGFYMKVINKLLVDIKPYTNNPRHNDNAVVPVMESIREFGFQQPIVIDKDGIIVAGHTIRLYGNEVLSDEHNVA